MVGHRRPVVGKILPGGGSVGATICIIDVIGVSIHQEGDGRLSTLVDMSTDGEADDKAILWELVLPPTRNRNGRFGIEGSFRVNRDHTHHGYVCGGGASPCGAGVPEMLGTGDPGTGGDAGDVKGGEYGGGSP